MRATMAQCTSLCGAAARRVQAGRRGAIRHLQCACRRTDVQQTGTLARQVRRLCIVGTCMSAFAPGAATTQTCACGGAHGGVQCSRHTRRTGSMGLAGCGCACGVQEPVHHKRCGQAKVPVARMAVTDVFREAVAHDAHLHVAALSLQVRLIIEPLTSTRCRLRARRCTQEASSSHDVHIAPASATRNGRSHVLPCAH